MCYDLSLDRLDETVLIMGQNIRFKEVTWKSIPKLFLLPLSDILVVIQMDVLLREATLPFALRPHFPIRYFFNKPKCFPKNAYSNLKE